MFVGLLILATPTNIKIWSRCYDNWQGHSSAQSVYHKVYMTLVKPLFLESEQYRHQSRRDDAAKPSGLGVFHAANCLFRGKRCSKIKFKVLLGSLVRGFGQQLPFSAEDKQQTKFKVCNWARGSTIAARKLEVMTMVGLFLPQWKHHPQPLTGHTDMINSDRRKAMPALFNSTRVQTISWVPTWREPEERKALGCPFASTTVRRRWPGHVIVYRKII